MTLTPNTVLQQRYVIQRQVGRGGTASVYEALDNRLSCAVALKQLVSVDAEEFQLCEGEARLLAKLRHPALPRVFDLFYEADHSFLVMEFIHGDDLAEQLRQAGKPFSPSDVMEWADQLLDALEYLHGEEPPIVHRDIKPQNLKLTKEGRIILLDFGLAKPLPPLIDPVTGKSLFAFTFNYAPLEQIQRRAMDARSDIYSLGATLYHLITGVTPEGAMTRAANIVGGYPDPHVPAHVLNQSVTAEVNDLIDLAMALKAEDRPRSATELRQALRSVNPYISAESRRTIPKIGRPIPAVRKAAVDLESARWLPETSIDTGRKYPVAIEPPADQDLSSLGRQIESERLYALRPVLDNRTQVVYTLLMVAVLIIIFLVLVSTSW